MKAINKIAKRGLGYMPRLGVMAFAHEPFVSNNEKASTDEKQICNLQLVDVQSLIVYIAR